jgi:hypothetical protein
MNVSWLINSSMAFDGSRFLSGDDEEPRLYEDPFAPLTIDASPIAGGGGSSSVDEFLPLARSSGIGGLGLLCSDALGLRLPAWESDPHLDEFVLATQDRDMAWQLKSRFKHMD